MFSRPITRVPSRRGFTVIELLVAMALIVFIMVVLSQGFSAAAENFRDLKGAGDQQEKLRGTAVNLRRDLDAAHFDAGNFVFDGLRAGSADRERAAELRKRYAAIATDAADFDAQLQELERKVESPADKRIIRRVRGYLEQIRFTTTATAKLLELFDPDD